LMVGSLGMEHPNNSTTTNGRTWQLK
jgi:hypothetical protein